MSKKINRNWKNQDLRGLKLKTSKDVFDIDKKGKVKIKKEFKIYGSVERNSPFILKKGVKNEKYRFIDDISNLNKKTKNEIVNYFENERTKKGNKRRIVYLVDEKKK